MTNEAFVALLESRVGKIRATLASKAKEYASDADRLHNFKAAASMLRTTPEQALLGMLVKHLVSVIDLVYDHEHTPVPAALVDEKVGDAINYLILLEAILKETP